MFDKDIIKKVVYDNIPEDLIELVMVFGSRARGEETAESDTDICIILKDELPREDVKKYRSSLNRVFATDYEMATDILMKSKYVFNRYKDVVGGIEHTLAKEGVVI